MSSLDGKSSDDPPARVRIHASTAWAVQVVMSVFLLIGVMGIFQGPGIGNTIFFIVIASFGLLGIVRAAMAGVEVRDGRVITRSLPMTRTYDDVVRVEVDEGLISGGRVVGAYVVLCLSDGRRVELTEQLSTYRWAERRRHTVSRQADRLARALRVPGPQSWPESPEPL